jgi:hypothetical protein
MAQDRAGRSSDPDGKCRTPRLGEHNAYVFGEILGLVAEEQQRLAPAGITR